MITARPRNLPASSSSKIASRSDSGPVRVDVRPNLAAGSEIDELAHVLHVADRGEDDRRLDREQVEQVDREFALARRRQTDADEEAGLAQELQAEVGSRRSGPRRRARRRRPRARAARLRRRSSGSTASSAPSERTKSRRSSPMSTPTTRYPNRSAAARRSGRGRRRRR